MWTKGQLTTYREQGFLVQRGLIPPDQIERLRSAADEMMSEQADNPPEVHVVREKSGPVRSVFCMHRNVQPFRRAVPLGADRRARSSRSSGATPTSSTAS